MLEFRYFLTSSFSVIRHSIGVIDMGRKSDGMAGCLTLAIGVMITFVQWAGGSPVAIER